MRKQKLSSPEETGRPVKSRQMAAHLTQALYRRNEARKDPRAKVGKPRGEIGRLIAGHRLGWSLAQPFYVSPDVFARDMERIFMRQWLFAGHVSQIPKPGDYFLFNIAKESLIIIRDKQGEIHALFNVCRHRGSRICLNPEGHARTLVCPYHAWVYGTDGKLLAAQAMPEEFDKADFGLHRSHVRVLEGLIFICMAKEAPPNEEAFRDWKKYLKPQGLAKAKIAARMKWEVNANWKLAIENFDECYHCGSAHPEYCSVMAHALPGTHNLPRQVEKFSNLVEEWGEKAEALGTIAGRETGDAHMCMRFPIKEGSLTQSRDGQPIAPLMGDFKEYDGGHMINMMRPGNYFIASCDHAVIPIFVPVSALRTDVDILWLVDGNAVEDRHYDLQELTWLWKVTTDQDKVIIDNNQAGVNSERYQSGMYSTTENAPVDFTRWYLNQIS